MTSLWAHLRNLRYALPGQIEQRVAGPDAAAAARISARLHRRGLLASVGYFQAQDGTADTITAANIAACTALAGQRGGAILSVKAPPLAFDAAKVAAIAAAAQAAGLTLMFDAHAPKDADATLALVDELLPALPTTGFALPARWQRSMGDALRFRDTQARIRLVKGEWADPVADAADSAAAYCALARALAGRKGMVAVATHDPALARQAIGILLGSGTPVELEQLRGLPRRRTMVVAAQCGVPTRIYVPFGPGWWPYAVDKALGRPYLPRWLLTDLLARR